jgi:hypothetical protein
VLLRSKYHPWAFRASPEVSGEHGTKVADPLLPHRAGDTKVLLHRGGQIAQVSLVYQGHFTVPGQTFTNCGIVPIGITPWPGFQCCGDDWQQTDQVGNGAELGIAPEKEDEDLGQDRCGQCDRPLGSLFEEKEAASHSESQSAKKP